MKRSVILVMLLVWASLVLAQTGAQNPSKPPAAAAGQSAAEQPGAAQTPAPQGKRPPQAKTQPEFDAYQAALGSANDPAAMEKAADDFAAKFPDSELRVLLYQGAMHSYQRVNNAEKMMDMGRKVLNLDPPNPEALVGVAQVLAERTRDTDLDKEQRWDEATKLAQHSLETVETAVASSPGTPQERIDAYKALLRSTAYYALGTVQYSREKYADAENYFRKSIDAYPAQVDPLAVLRLALALDKQEKYPDALKFANQAVDLAQADTTLGNLARNERDRLIKLTGGIVPAPAPKPPASATNPQPPSK